MPLKLDLNSTDSIRQYIIQEFSSSPNRRNHILAVTDFCIGIGKQIKESHPELTIDTTILEQAALLHDIGYLPVIEKFLSQEADYQFTGWHPIDGANFLRAHDKPLLAKIIEGHSHSQEMAALLNLSPFVQSTALEAKILSFCDTQVGPDGERISYQERIKELEQRKGASSTSVKAHKNARERILQIHDVIHELTENLPPHCKNN